MPVPQFRREYVTIYVCNSLHMQSITVFVRVTIFYFYFLAIIFRVFFFIFQQNIHFTHYRRRLLFFFFLYRKQYFRSNISSRNPGPHDWQALSFIGYFELVNNILRFFHPRQISHIYKSNICCKQIKMRTFSFFSMCHPAL